jgi:glycosyltransferase involved in cell wall biosynthesis
VDATVCITSYNQKRVLVEAIESALAQTMPAAEIIVVDDCSCDGSRDVIESYMSLYPERISAIFHERNLGVSQARTTALNRVNTRYVTCLDGDDRFLPGKLEKETRLLKGNRHAAIAFSDHYVIAVDGTRTGSWLEGQTPPSGDIFVQTYSRSFPKGRLFRNELVEYPKWKEIGFYDPRLNVYEDYEMRIRLTKRLRAVCHDEPLAEYRCVGGGLSSAGARDHLASLEYIHDKNRFLLADLSSRDQREVEHGIRKFRARLQLRSATELLNSEEVSILNQMQAARWGFSSFCNDPGIAAGRVLLRAVLPHLLIRLLLRIKI